MSASPPKSGLIVTQMRNVAKGPEATRRRIKFDRLVSGRKYRNDPADRLGSLRLIISPNIVGLMTGRSGLRARMVTERISATPYWSYPILYP